MIIMVMIRTTFMMGTNMTKLIMTILVRDMIVVIIMIVNIVTEVVMVVVVLVVVAIVISLAIIRTTSTLIITCLYIAGFI